MFGVYPKSRPSDAPSASPTRCSQAGGNGRRTVSKCAFAMTASRSGFRSPFRFVLPSEASELTNSMTLLASGERVVVSAPSPEVVAQLRRSLPTTPIRAAGRSVVLGSGEPSPSGGRLGAISAGTSDVPVLEEAVAVAREMGADIRSFHDVGVAGIHRLVAPLKELRDFDPDCLIVAAGMEGALPSVIAGLVAVPVVVGRLVVGHGADEITKHLAEAAPDAVTVLQEVQRGTGHAARMCEAELK